MGKYKNILSLNGSNPKTDLLIKVKNSSILRIDQFNHYSTVAVALIQQLKTYS